MPRPDVITRAREYLSKVPGAISGSGGHTHTLLTARALVRGFELNDSDALSLLAEWNKACDPPWSVPELEHKINSARKGPPPDKGDGYLLNGDEEKPGGPAAPPPKREEPPKYDHERLEKFAAQWAGEINLLWLANRSVLDPAATSTDQFLRALYRKNECVYIARADWGDGECIWPHDPLPTAGQDGMKFLAQPVNGEWRPNPRSFKKKRGEYVLDEHGKRIPQMSLRSKENVTSWRFLLLESDKAPAKLWLAALVQLPLRISAIYTSGGKSVHALVRLDARTEMEWMGMRQRLMPGVVALGADERSLTSVRLTRLPGFFRAEKGGWQKLLYVNPEPQAEPLISTIPRRNVEKVWFEAAVAFFKQATKSAESLQAWEEIIGACQYYERFSTRLRDAAKELGELREEFSGVNKNE